MERNNHVKENIILILFSLLCTVTLKMNLDVIQNSSAFTQYLDRFQDNVFIDIIIFVSLYYFYKKIYYYGKGIFKSKKTMLLITFNAVLFAGFTILGYSFYKEDSWDMLFCSKVQILKSVFCFVGYMVLFVNVLVFLYTSLDDRRSVREYKSYTETQNFYLRWLEKYPFRTTMISLIIMYIPYIIASYPGIFTGDTFDIIYQGYNIPTWSSSYRPLINNNVILNNHHPVAYTMFLHYCIAIGKRVFHSYNIGVFICSVLQFLFMIGVISLLIKFLAYINISPKVNLILIAYFVFSPRLQNYMFLLSKDVCYTAFVMLHLIMFYNLITGTKDKKYYIGFIISAIGILIFRNDGKYMLCITLIVAIFMLKETRKLFAVMFITIIVLNGLYNDVLLPGFQITPGSKREMLSIPLQQTARYKRDYPEDVTKEEKKAISAVLDYDNLEKLYVPSLSDNIKFTFKEEATSEQLKKYFQAWFQQFCRHPEVYIEATINNLYEYVSPYSKNAIAYSYKNVSYRVVDQQKNKCHKYGLDFSFPSKLETYRDNFEELREKIFNMPLLILFLKPFIYIWILLIWFLYVLKLKNKKAVLMCIPLIVQCLICVAGPTNGSYFRYLYPIAMCLPMVVMSGWTEIKSQE